MKITEEELAELEVWDITFYTEDEEGNKCANISRRNGM